MILKITNFKITAPSPSDPWVDISTRKNCHHWLCSIGSCQNCHKFCHWLWWKLSKWPNFIPWVKQKLRETILLLPVMKIWSKWLYFHFREYWIYQNEIQHYNWWLDGWCKRDVTPLLTHWSYVSFALSHGSDGVLCLCHVTSDWPILYLADTHGMIDGLNCLGNWNENHWLAGWWEWPIGISDMPTLGNSKCHGVV